MCGERDTMNSMCGCLFATVRMDLLQNKRVAEWADEKEGARGK